MRIEVKEEHSQKHGNGGKQEYPGCLPMLTPLSPKAVPSGTVKKHDQSLHGFFGKGNINMWGIGQQKQRPACGQSVRRFRFFRLLQPNFLCVLGTNAPLLFVEKNAIFSCQTPLRTIKIADLADGWIAQLVEQRTENPCVPGSNPGPATIFPLFDALKAIWKLNHKTSKCQEKSEKTYSRPPFEPDALLASKNHSASPVSAPPAEQPQFQNEQKLNDSFPTKNDQMIRNRQTETKQPSPPTRR